MKKLMLSASIALFAAVSLFSIGNDNEIRVNEALAGGTCCDKQGATCYPGDCSSSYCSQPGAYWTTGECKSESDDPVISVL